MSTSSSASIPIRRERRPARKGTRFEAEAAAVVDAQLDAVVVATPEHLHRGPVELALGTGAAVLCEKPFASSLEDADAMIGAAEASGRPLLVARGPSNPAAPVGERPTGHGYGGRNRSMRRNREDSDSGTGRTKR